MSVYIHRPDDSVYSVNRQVALVGFTLRGEDVKLFEEDEIETIPIIIDDIVFGSVKLVRRAFERLGLAVHPLESVPAPLSGFAGRLTWESTIAEAREIVEGGGSVFIKPISSQLKLFTGHPLRKFADLIATANLPDDTRVECAQVTPFVSEFRTFVLHGDVIGLRHYGGNPLQFPDPDVIRSIISQYEAAPASYALDVGVVEDGSTKLVEVNDSYATGAYGLAPALYASFIDARWAELRRSLS